MVIQHHFLVWALCDMNDREKFLHTEMPRKVTVITSKGLKQSCMLTMQLMTEETLVAN